MLTITIRIASESISGDKSCPVEKKNKIQQQNWEKTCLKVVMPSTFASKCDSYVWLIKFERSCVHHRKFIFKLFTLIHQFDTSAVATNHSFSIYLSNSFRRSAILSLFLFIFLTNNAVCAILFDLCSSLIPSG